MRVTTVSLFRQLTRSLQENLRDLSRFSERLSTGKRINKPSDSISGMSQSMDYKVSLNRINQYRRNIDDALSHLSFAETTMDSVTNVLIRVKELAVQGANGSQDADSRNAIAQEVGNLKDEILNAANSKFRNRYIFSGYSTDTAAYDSSFNYQGDSGEIKVMIDPNATIAVNIPGSRAFSAGGATYFETLDDLYNALVGNNQSAIQSSIGSIENALNQVSEVRADYGGKLSYLEDVKNNLADRDVNLQNLLSNVEDTDVAETVSEMSRTEIALQSLRNAGAQIIPQSLFDYLR